MLLKTHREDPQNFPKIEDVPTFPIVPGHTKRTSNQYHHAARVNTEKGSNRTFSYLKNSVSESAIILIVACSSKSI